MNLNRKRLLILAGAAVHCKLVKAAQEMGIYTVVTDNVPNSQAKNFSDKAYNVDIYDIVGLENICKKEQIDGVLGCYIDPCQKPYNELCERLGFPCYGSKEQFYYMTNKREFKKKCIENNVGVIPEYYEDKLTEIDYPVFVKPVDSRGSRGQTTCYNQIELKEAIEKAKLESKNGVILEKYMGDAQEFQVTYFLKDGQPFLLRTADSYCGSARNHLDKVVACSVSPSKYTDLFLQEAHVKLVKMFKQLGLKNGPVFMQGFVDEGKFRFFDPGLRFPGVDFDLMYKRVFDVDIMKAMIAFSLSGSIDDQIIPQQGYLLGGKKAAILFPTIKSGIVGAIKGELFLNSTKEVVSYQPRWNVGAHVPWSYNVNQRSAEIDVLCDDTKTLRDAINKIQDIYKVLDDNGRDMTFELFDAARIQ